MSVSAATWRLAGINLATRVDDRTAGASLDFAVSLYTIRSGRLQTAQFAPPDALAAAAHWLERQPAEAWALIAEGGLTPDRAAPDAWIIDVGDVGGTARIAVPFCASGTAGFAATTPEVRAALLEGAGPRVGARLSAALGGEPAAEAPPPAQITAWTSATVACAPDDVIEALRAGYAAVLLAIADADGHLDPTERRAFTTWLTGATRGEGPAAALLPDGPGPVIASLDAFLSERATANSAIFRTLAALNGHCDPGARRAYAHELRSLGKEIAEASHGGLRTWWRKISPAEQRALDMLDALLATLEV